MPVRILAFERPDLMKEWCFERNKDIIAPDEVSISSTEKVWWKCSKCGYEWKASIISRARKTQPSGCPYCGGKVVIKGKNDLATLCPELMKEWNWGKNTDIDPYSVSKGSGKKAWWKCSTCGHEWQAVIGNRSKGVGCPECAKKTNAIKNQKRNVIIGKSDFLTLYPQLASEWDYDANDSLDPQDYGPGSSKKVWWRCKTCGHKWQATISHRTNGKGCPQCANRTRAKYRRKASLKDGKNTLQTMFPHISEEWDYEKNNGLTPNDITPKSEYKAWWKCSKCGGNWQATVLARSKGSECPYCLNRSVRKGYNDFATTNPELMSEWLFSKNTIAPDEITAASQKKVWWKCPTCGYEYQAALGSRTQRHRGCPVCANKKVVIGINDLKTKAPQLYEEWLTERNAVDPLTISTGNKHKFWWKCSKCGHEWQASVDNRFRGRGCPKCKIEIVTQKLHEHRLSDGTNTIAALYPESAKDWDYEKNAPLVPEDVIPGSTKKYWWICPQCGSSYKESANLKTKRLIGCPKCSRKYSTSIPEQIIYHYVKQYYPDVINSYKPKWLHGSEIDIFIPQLMYGIEYDGLNWHRDINRDLKKDKLMSDNSIRVIRIREKGCPELHDSSIVIETNGEDQQYQYMVDVLERLFAILLPKEKTKHIVFNIEDDLNEIIVRYRQYTLDKSLALVHPELVSEWNFQKNGHLKPEMIMARSARKVWWRCPKCGYEWKAAVSSRSAGIGCPVCAGAFPTPGINDLKTLYPSIAAEWDYQKNNGLKPEECLPGSAKAVWWKCSRCGYEWKETINYRVRAGKCPRCDKKNSQGIHGRAVMNVDTGRIYNSLHEASIDVGVGQAQISACCRGKQKTAAGYRWKYLDEAINE